MTNFDFYLCLCVKFHKSLFWVLILAAGGLYFTKKWVPIGSLSQSLGVPNCFGDSDTVFLYDVKDCYIRQMIVVGLTRALYVTVPQ